MTQPTERLDELDKEEMRDVAKIMDANYSDEKFDADWHEFIQMKRGKVLN